MGLVLFRAENLILKIADFLPKRHKKLACSILLQMIVFN